MNRVELIGKLVFPVEVHREPGTGRAIGKAMIAVSRGVQGLDFVPVTLREREAVDAAKYLGEGSVVAITGHIHSTLLTERDAGGGRRRRRLVHVIVDRLIYVTVRSPRAGEQR